VVSWTDRNFDADGEILALGGFDYDLVEDLKDSWLAFQVREVCADFEELRGFPKRLPARGYFG